MRIVSANLNQRLGNPAVRSRVELWLGTKAPDLFLSQEPFKPSQLDTARHRWIPAGQHLALDLLLDRAKARLPQGRRTQRALARNQA